MVGGVYEVAVPGPPDGGGRVAAARLTCQGQAGAGGNHLGMASLGIRFMDNVFLVLNSLVNFFVVMNSWVN